MNDVTNFVISCSIVELFIHRESQNPGLPTTLHTPISTTVHTTANSFVPFCSAQDGESTDMNYCLVF